MPTFKHPCPHCGTFIERDVAACPACGRPDPFAPGRCPSCSAMVEPGWVACPKCGVSLVETSAQADTVAPPHVASPEGSATPPETSAEPVTSPPETASPATAVPCSACGRPLPAGARFCRECGTAAG